MPDLSEIVDFGAVTYAGGIEHGPVNGGVGPHLDGVADGDFADLRDFLDARRGPGEAEAVRAEHGTRMQDAAFADVRSGHEHGIRIDGGALAYADVLAHVDAGEELDAASHLGMGTDVNEGVNGHPVAEFGIGVNEANGLIPEKLPAVRRTTPERGRKSW